jgi:serine-type D-Ala-D-Ala carboxypeptidase/endopeptidase
MGVLSRVRNVSHIGRFLLPFALLASCLLCLSEAQTARQISENSGQDQRVKSVASAFFSNPCHVGLSLVIVQGRKVRFYNYGSTSRARRVTPTADSVYEIASVTKTFTDALAAEAVFEHRMELDADFRRYLPAPYPNLTWQGRPFTLRDLATHASGLPRDLPDTDDLYAHRNPETLPSKLIARDTGYDRERYLRELHDVRLRSEPGSKEEYSNLGFKVMGWGLERVYGMSFEQLLRTHISEPLRMSSTGFVLNPEEQARLVTGYSPAGHVMPYHLRNAGAAYGLYSTPRDMARYVEWQLNESNPVVRLAHQPIEGAIANGKALPWNLATVNGVRMLWHGGGTFGMSSQIVLFPDEHRREHAGDNVSMLERQVELKTNFHTPAEPQKRSAQGYVKGN